MSSKTNIHVYFFANYFLDGIEISTIQIAKWFYFLSPLRGFVMVMVRVHRGTASLTPAYYLSPFQGLEFAVEKWKEKKRFDYAHKKRASQFVKPLSHFL